MADTNAEAVGIRVLNYIQANGGDCSQNLASLVRDFQTAYNADVDRKIFTGPKVVVDGKYGDDTASAFADAFIGKNTPTPRPLYGQGNPCFGCGILPGGKSIPAGVAIIAAEPLGQCAAFPNAGGGLVTPPGGNFIPSTASPVPDGRGTDHGVPINTNTNTTTTTTTKVTTTNYVPWVAAALGIAAGVGIFYAVRKNQNKVPDTIRSPMNVAARPNRTLRRTVRTRRYA